jgi:predicted esterase
VERGEVSDASRPRNEALHLAWGLALSFSTVLGTMLVTATGIALAARAWTWVQLGLAGTSVVFASVLWLALRHRPRARRVALALAVLGLARVGWAARPGAPRATPGALVKTRFVAAPNDAWLWLQGVPERETMRLGAWVGLSDAEKARSGAALESEYAAIEASDLFERSDSPLLDSWLFDHEHYWLAVPPGAGPFPLVVFVHGNGGTFEMYPHLLARACVAHGLAVAFLSHGFGFWDDAPDAARRIGRVVEAVAREIPVDRSRVSLIGLSAGGPGIFGAALEEPGKYRALVAVSTIYPTLSAERWARLGKTRVLLVHGARDPRAPVGDARNARDALVKASVPVELREFPEEDHLALLTARDTWVPLVLDWHGLSRD